MKESKEPFDAGNETQVKERKTKNQLRVEKEVEELRQICNDKKVRDYLWRVISRCGVYSDGFTGNSTTFYNEGKRRIGLDIIVDLMAADPKIYSIMRLENAQGDE